MHQAAFQISCGARKTFLLALAHAFACEDRAIGEGLWRQPAGARDHFRKPLPTAQFIAAGVAEFAKQQHRPGIQSIFSAWDAQALARRHKPRPAAKADARYLAGQRGVWHVARHIWRACIAKRRHTPRDRKRIGQGRIFQHGIQARGAHLACHQGGVVQQEARQFWHFLKNARAARLAHFGKARGPRMGEAGRGCLRRLGNLRQRHAFPALHRGCLTPQGALDGAA